MLQRKTTLCIASVICVLIQTSGNAAPFLPSGVAPGTPYHLVFVTRDGHDGISSSIADYNTFTNAQAA
jgi:hypothetical protein